MLAHPPTLLIPKATARGSDDTTGCKNDLLLAEDGSGAVENLNHVSDGKRAPRDLRYLVSQIGHDPSPVRAVFSAARASSARAAMMP